MKKYFVALTIVLVSSFHIWAQSDPDAKEFRIVAPMDDRFSVESVVDITEKITKTKDDFRAFAGQLDNRWFRVFSIKSDSQSSLGSIEGFVMKHGASFSSPRSLNTLYATSFEDDDGFFHNISLIGTKTRLYVAHAITLNDEKDKDVGNRFVSSLKVNDQKALAASGAEELIPSVSPTKGSQQTTTGANPSGPKPASGGTGSGKSGGIGAGGNSTTPSSKPSDYNSGLKILSKPRALYTDLARIYQIEGNVTLRIKFLADGTVGDIQTVSKLPFGLTTNAVQAAKRVGFEPAYVNGKPMPVTKTFQYSFTLY